MIWVADLDKQQVNAASIAGTPWDIVEGVMLIGSGNQIDNGFWSDSLTGWGNNNVITQKGTFWNGDNATVSGDRNIVTQAQGDISTIWGDGNETRQSGKGDTVEIGDQGFLSTGLGGKKGADDHVIQTGDNDSATVHGNQALLEQTGKDDVASITGDKATALQAGDSDEFTIKGKSDAVVQTGDDNHATVEGDRSTVAENGNHNRTHVKGNGIQVEVHGNHNDIKIDSDKPVGVKVFGDGITVRQSDGKLVATDKDGNPVPIQTGRDGSLLVGNPPASELPQPVAAPRALIPIPLPAPPVYGGSGGVYPGSGRIDGGYFPHGWSANPGQGDYAGYGQPWYRDLPEGFDSPSRYGDDWPALNRPYDLSNSTDTLGSGAWPFFRGPSDDDTFQSDWGRMQQARRGKVVWAAAGVIEA